MIGAADPPQDSPGAAAPPADLLAGPKVDAEDAEIGGEGDLLRRRVPIRFDQWREMFDSLELTDAQRAEARDAILAHRQQRQAYLREHGERIRGLRELVRASREGGRSGDQRIIAELRDLESAVPAYVDALEKLWSILTVPQQAELRRKFREFRDEAIAKANTDAPRSPRDIQADDGSEDEMMQEPSGSMMMGDATSENIESPDAGALDAAARKRLAFLRSRQLKPRGE